MQAIRGGGQPPSSPRLLVLFILAGLTARVFAGVLFAGGMFAYRDAAHFYYPLLEFTRNQWAAGRIPLWNPYENLGTPLAGNPAAAVFYPGMLILALPFGFAWCYRLYVIGHLLLAAAGAYVVARRWNASPLAAGCGSLSYAFCGNVLIQHANVIFLVGAAWLPFALWATDRMLLGRSLRAALALGAVLAMMVLGGDPQMAYNAGLLAGLYALLMPALPMIPADQRKAGNGRAPARRPGGSAARASILLRCSPRPSAEAGLAARAAGPRLAAWLRSPACGRARVVLLLVAAVAAVVLSAVQVLPSIEFASRSDRAVSTIPRSLYEVPGCLGGDRAGRRVADGLLCRNLEPGTHRESLYHFSVGPWRLAEYLWPNVSGRQYPVHRRWLDVLPAEARVWAPSLYMGLLPLVLALAAVRLRRAPPRDRWLSWTALLAVLASLGWFGLGWLLQEILHAAGGEPGDLPFGPPVGGLYWLMTVLLPGYAQFRYPAKLLVVAAMALSLLAARGWDRAFAGRMPRLPSILLGLAGVSLAAVAVAVAIRPWWTDWMSRVEADTLFGPLDAAAAWGDLLGGFLQTAMLALAFWWLLRRGSKVARWVPGVALVLVAADLGVANRWLVATAPAELWQTPSRVAAAISTDYASRDMAGSLRVYRRPLWLRPEWRSKSSPDRFAEEIRWDRDTLWPNYQLSVRLPVCEVAGTMALADYAELLAEARRGADGKTTSLPNRGFLDQVGAEYLILREDEAPPDDSAVPIDVGPEDCSLWWNPRALDRAWVEPDGWREHRPARVTHADPLRVEVEAAMPEAGRVVLADQFYPGWHVEVQTRGQGTRAASIECAHRVMRAVKLPAGQHRLIFTYRPAWLPWGVAVTALGWLGVGIGSLATARLATKGRGK